MSKLGVATPVEDQKSVQDGWLVLGGFAERVERDHPQRSISTPGMRGP